MSNKKIKPGDLAKSGSQFVIVYQSCPCIILPIVEKNPEMHRTDVQISGDELFCLTRPNGVLTIKLVDCKEIDGTKLNKIGKVSRAAIARVELALSRERHMQSIETGTRSRTSSTHTSYKQTGAYTR